MTLVGKLTLCLLCVTVACAGAALPHRDYSHGSNGNLTRQVVADPDYLWIYHAEKRLTGVSGAAAATFVYDGDGNRVKATFGATATVYVGNIYELTNGVAKKYYYAGDRRIALRDNGTLHYLFPDHLGSSNVSVRADNSATVVQRYYPWGTVRPGPNNALPTCHLLPATLPPPPPAPAESSPRPAPRRSRTG